MDFPPELVREWARLAFEVHATTSESGGTWDDLEDSPEEVQAWLDVARRVGALAVAYAEGRLMVPDDMTAPRPSWGC